MHLQWEHEGASGFYQCRHWMIQGGYFCLREVVGGTHPCLFGVFFLHASQTGADGSIGSSILAHRIWSLD